MNLFSGIFFRGAAAARTTIFAGALFAGIGGASPAFVPIVPENYQSRQSQLGTALVVALKARFASAPIAFDYREFVLDEEAELNVTGLTATIYPMRTNFELGSLNGAWREIYGYSLGIRKKMPRFSTMAVEIAQVDAVKTYVEQIALFLLKLKPYAGGFSWQRVREVELAPEISVEFLRDKRIFVAVVAAAYQVDVKP